MDGKVINLPSAIKLHIVDSEDVKIGRKRKGNNNDTKVLTKRSSKEKEELVEKLGLKGKKTIEVKKTIRIPVHYDTTGKKLDILNNLTARITYGIRLISEVVYDLVKDVEHSKVLSEGTDEELKFLKLNVIEEIVNNSNIVEKTGLQSTYIQQCINKVIFSYKSYRDLHKKWEGKVERAEERLEGSRDDKELEKADDNAEIIVRHTQTGYRDTEWFIPQVDVALAYYVKLVLTLGLVDETATAAGLGKQTWAIFPTNASPFLVFRVPPERIFKNPEECLVAFKTYAEELEKIYKEQKNEAQSAT